MQNESLFSRPYFRFHAWVRSRTAPIHEIAAQLPEHGVVLDFGCGSCVLESLCVDLRPHLKFVSYDIDDRKLAFARRMRLANVLLVTSDWAEVQEGVPFDAAVIIDVLYLLDRTEMLSALKVVSSRLKPGAPLLVKMMDVHLTMKSWVDRTQEFLSVKLLGLTRSADRRLSMDLDPAEVVGVLKALGHSTTTLSLDQGYLHPHILIRAC